MPLYFAQILHHFILNCIYELSHANYLIRISFQFFITKNIHNNFPKLTSSLQQRGDENQAPLRISVRNKSQKLK